MNKIMNKFDFSDKVILVVEDTETSNKFFEAALSRTNAKLLWATDGKEAIEIFDKNHIDIILLDLNLLSTNGFEVLKHVRNVGSNVPVLVQTAYVLAGEEKTSFELGADAFIAKPIKLNQLMETIDELLKKK
jgi:DNA-binding response OmpR family regulator